MILTSSTFISSPKSSASLLASSFLLHTGNWSDSWDLTISASSFLVTAWLPSENDVTDRMVLKKELFWRPVILQLFFGGQPLGLGGMIGIFFGGENIYYLNFSRRNRIVLIEIYPKMNFYRIFQTAPILDHSSDKSLFLGNRLEPIERSPWFLPIPMVFGLWKNPSINLLPLFVRHCSCQSISRRPRYQSYVVI